MDHLKLTLGEQTYQVKLTVDLLCQLEEKFGAVTSLLKLLENGQMPYHQMIDIGSFILAEHLPNGLEEYVLEEGVKDIQEMIFHLCARYSLGQEYLKQVAGDPILGEA